MTKWVALIVASGAGWGSHALLGDLLSPLADFGVSTAVSAVVYVPTVLWLKRLQG